MNISKITGMMAVDPGPLGTRLRAAAMPGEDPLSLMAPEDFIALCIPEWQETGKLYDFRADRVVSFMPPS